MTYRDGTASLEERHRMLRRALQETRSRSSALTNEEALLHRELASLHQKLESACLEKKRQRGLPMIAQPVSTLIASPCDVPWNDMVGDARVRRCGKCERDVFNLSAMTRDEVDAFLANAKASKGVASSNGQRQAPCVGLWQRADGTMLTADCPVGIRRRRVRALIAVGFGVGTAALVGFAMLGAPGMSDDKTVCRGAGALSDLPRRSFDVDNGGGGGVNGANGFVHVAGVAGLCVYENNQLKGTVPVSFAATPGTHILRVEDPKTPGQSELLSTVVHERSVSTVTASGFITPADQNRSAAVFQAGGI